MQRKNVADTTVYTKVTATEEVQVAHSHLAQIVGPAEAAHCVADATYRPDWSRA
jgi:hypothetical protein